MKAAIYARVSRRKEQSIQSQLTACRRYCEERDWEVAKEYIEDGARAFEDKAWNRPIFNRLLDDVDDGRYGVIVVWESARLVRNVLYAKLVKRDLRDAGVQIAYVNRPDLDPESDDGAFMQESLDEILDEMESRRISRRVTRGLRHRAHQGLFLGDPPWGYCRGDCSECQDPNGKGYCPRYGGEDRSDGRVLVPHPVDAEGVRLAFELHATGEYSDRQVAMALNERGYRTNRKWAKKKNAQRPGGPGPLTKDTVRGILQNETYLGYIKYHGELLEGAHDPLIGVETFDRSQEMRSVLAHVPRGRAGQNVRAYPLSGLLRCPHGHRMRGHVNHGVRHYTDAARDQRGGCDMPPLEADQVEGGVTEIVTAISLPADWKAQIRQYMMGDEDVEVYEAQRLAVKMRRNRLKTMYLDGLLDDAQYQAERDEILAMEAELSPPEMRDVLDAGEVVVTLRRAWANATPVEQKRLCNMIFEEIQIDEAGEITAIRPTAAFHPLLAHVRERRDSNPQIQRVDLLPPKETTS